MTQGSLSSKDIVSFVSCDTRYTSRYADLEKTVSLYEPNNVDVWGLLAVCLNVVSIYYVYVPY